MFWWTKQQQVDKDYKKIIDQPIMYKYKECQSNQKQKQKQKQVKRNCNQSRI